MVVKPKYKIGDVMIFEGAYAVIDEILLEDNDIRYLGIWSDDGKRAFLRVSNLQEVVIVTKEVWNSPLYKIMREND